MFSQVDYADPVFSFDWIDQQIEQIYKNDMLWSVEDAHKADKEMGIK